MEDVIVTGKEYSSKKIKFQDTYQTSIPLCFEFLNSNGVQKNVFVNWKERKSNFEETDKVSWDFSFSTSHLEWNA